MGTACSVGDQQCCSVARAHGPDSFGEYQPNERQEAQRELVELAPPAAIQQGASGAPALEDGEDPGESYFERELEELQRLRDTGPDGLRPLYTFKTGAEYFGQWKGHCREGKGEQKWPDGASFIGNWRGSNAEGLGQFAHADGDVFVGEWTPGPSLSAEAAASVPRWGRPALLAEDLLGIGDDPRLFQTLPLGELLEGSELAPKATTINAMSLDSQRPTAVSFVPHYASTSPGLQMGSEYSRWAARDAASTEKENSARYLAIGREAAAGFVIDWAMTRLAALNSSGESIGLYQLNEVVVHRPSPAGKAHQKHSVPKQAVLGHCRAFEGEQLIAPAIGGTAFRVFKEAPPPRKSEMPAEAADGIPCDDLAVGICAFHVPDGVGDAVVAGAAARREQRFAGVLAAFDAFRAYALRERQVLIESGLR
ncbi:unnamed protein product [Prorocentrum cordatum]|uniref:Uncharacterized protein n=1 Tax=Prorocentrum cordatum TaxID=2364126 RepID=A0ABN9RJK2_9DINO|nr:unnamed protein product [Polarella glacialis]